MRAPPSKLVSLAPKRPSKNFRVRHQKRIFQQNSTEGGLFGSAGGRLPEGGRRLKVFVALSSNLEFFGFVICFRKTMKA